MNQKSKGKCTKGKCITAKITKSDMYRISIASQLYMYRIILVFPVQCNDNFISSPASADYTSLLFSEQITNEFEF